MINKLKPTSKVIQIIKDNYSSGGRPILTVLCKDGSIWSRYEGEWQCDLDSMADKFEEENKRLKDGLNKIANHFEDHSTIHSQAKTLKRMARTYLNKSLREVAKDNDFEPRTKEEKRASFELHK
jgi:hypothetical protein